MSSKPSRRGLGPGRRRMPGQTLRSPQSGGESEVSALSVGTYRFPRKWYCHLTNRNRLCKIFGTKLLILSEGKLGRYSTGTELCIHRSLVRFNHAQTVAVGTDVMEPKPITHPRIHETPRFSAKIMVVREASRNSTPLCWDLRDEVSVSAEDVADEPRSRRQCEWPGEMLGRDCRSCPRGKTG
jgi:hypothetical protein